MLFAGSNDGVYSLTDVKDSGKTTVEQALNTSAVRRLLQLDGFDGLFAATASGLYHSPDGDEWSDLGVPRENVYAVAGRAGKILYAGTRPAHLYTAQVDDRGRHDGIEWEELDEFQEQPSRDEWRLPRHEDLAQVRDVHVPAGVSNRLVAGVEVGGVHVSNDRGSSWTERRGGVHDDIHELRIVGSDTFVAATGFGLFRSTDAGKSWTRLDEGYEQRYFRSLCVMDSEIYAGSALAHTATWEDDDADPELFVCRDGETLEPVSHPRPDETVTGMTTLDGSLVAATHRGTVLLRQDGDWSIAGTLPRADNAAVGYTPLCPLGVTR